MEDFNQFEEAIQLSNSSDLISFSKASLSELEVLQEYLNYAVLAAFALFAGAFILLENFNINLQAKTISIFKLYGLSAYKTMQRLLVKDIKFYGITIAAIVAILLFIVQNMTLSFILELLLYYGAIFMTFILVSCICIFRVYIRSNYADLLKNNDLTGGILKLSLVTKMIVSLVLVITLSFLFTSSQDMITSYNQLKVMQNNAHLTLFPSVTAAETEGGRDVSGLNRFFSLISEKEIPHIYESFSDYDVYDSQDIAQSNIAIKQGTDYPIGNVDVNYLISQNITLYDKDNEIIDATNMSKLYFIFPKESVQYYDNFISWFKSDVVGGNLANEDLYDFALYTYEAEQLPRMSPDSQGMATVNSQLILSKPIIRVINSSISENYIGSPYGLSIAGIGLNTGLKFNSGLSKTEFYESLVPMLEESSTQNLLTISNFASVGELLGDNFIYQRNIVMVQTGILLAVGMVYFYIMYQNSILILKRQRKEISVKRMLGFNTFKVYENMWIGIIITNFISICILLVLVFIREESLNYLTLISGLVTVVDILFFMIISRIYELKNNIDVLKGDSK